MSSREQAPASNWDYLEVWVDPTASPPYVLLLLGENSGACRVLDPAEQKRVVFSSGSYDEAKFWLLGDEYERVNGRFFNQESEEETELP